MSIHSINVAKLLQFQKITFLYIVRKLNASFLIKTYFFPWKWYHQSRHRNTWVYQTPKNSGFENKIQPICKMEEAMCKVLPFPERILSVTEN